MALCEAAAARARAGGAIAAAQQPHPPRRGLRLRALRQVRPSARRDLARSLPVLPAIAARRRGAGRSERDTGSSQWFVTTAPQPHIVGEYTRFGEVVEGLHVVKQLVPGSRLLHVTIERIAPDSGVAGAEEGGS